MKKKGNSGTNYQNIILLLLFIIFLCILAIFLVRLFSSKYLDDVSPGRFCSPSLIEKSDILFVIPLKNSISIAEDDLWCKKILSLNKTLGMHGVYHAPDSPGEFAITRDEEYVQKGMEEFKKCFGFYPSLFKAPELKLSKENEKLLKEMNLIIVPRINVLLHKTYHCVDKEQKSYLVILNKFVEWF